MGLPSPETDREALVALFNATGGPNWTRNDNWLSDVPISEWEQVTTDDNGRVTELELGGNQLSGEIPPELGNLENLTVLTLFGNHLTGEIPPELGNLTNLTELWLSFNQLSGEIPPELGNLAHLQELYLHFNQLSGEIPPELGSLTSLTALGLASNQLSGEIPHWLGNLDYLTWLVLGENHLRGLRAAQFVGPVGDWWFRTSWYPVLPVRAKLTRPIAGMNPPWSAQEARRRILCALRNVRAYRVPSRAGPSPRALQCHRPQRIAGSYPSFQTLGSPAPGVHCHLAADVPSAMAHERLTRNASPGQAHPVAWLETALFTAPAGNSPLS